MLIDAYHIQLERLTQAEIERVRQWRNDDHIREHMLYQAKITPEQQQRWFETINNDKNHYFLISTGDQKVGLINCIDIDWERQTGFAGLFIHDKTFWSTHVPVLASLTLLDVFINLLGIKEIHAIVRKDNLPAQSYNQQLGFLINEAEYTEDSILMTVTPESYEQAGKNLRKSAQSSFGQKISIRFTEHDFPGREDILRKFRIALEKQDPSIDIELPIT